MYQIHAHKYQHKRLHWKTAWKKISDLLTIVMIYGLDNYIPQKSKYKLNY